MTASIGFRESPGELQGVFNGHLTKTSIAIIVIFGTLLPSSVVRSRTLYKSSFPR